MSQTLVDSFPFPAPHQLLLKDPVVAQPHVSLSFTPPTTNRLISREERWVAQLAHLASQHHNSEYNRIKFGPKGCPIIYVPLSIQMPNYIKELQARQVLCISQKAWWPSREPSSEKMAERPIVLGPCGPLAQSTPDLQQEIFAAMAEPLANIPQMPPPNSTLRLQVKTSETHPINVSMIIPFEALPIISSHLTIPQNLSPVMFDISPIYTLDRITAYSFPPTMSLGDPKTCNSFLHVRNQSSVTGALQAVLNAATASKPIQPNGHPRTENAFSISKHERTYLELPMSVKSLRAATNLDYEPKSDWTPDVSRTPVLLPVPSIPDFVSMSPTSQNECAPSPSFMLGNLFLSSCPGKKVRLNGPVKGRSTVCRDLDTDLRRMKDLGVRCIVCCLDDDELEFLGASWAEYSRAAEEAGLDILRIPIPEGFAPLSPSNLDAHLHKLITSYTMRGIPVLVHCRGGVGRAGLVACCWALKLGLCGWIETGTGPPGVIRRDTLQLVERMIVCLRKRRSAKAIETYEQVKFLVDYVEFLRERPLQMEAFGTSFV